MSWSGGLSRLVRSTVSVGVGLLLMSASCSHQTRLDYGTTSEQLCSRISPTNLDPIFGPGFKSRSLGRGQGRACAFGPARGDFATLLAEAPTTGGGLVV